MHCSWLESYVALVRYQPGFVLGDVDDSIHPAMGRQVSCGCWWIRYNMGTGTMSVQPPAIVCLNTAVRLTALAKSSCW
jgi:hypothetical protein